MMLSKKTGTLERLQMNNKNECKNPGHQDFSAGKGAFQDPDNLSSSSKTHVVEGKN